MPGPLFSLAPQFKHVCYIEIYNRAAIKILEQMRMQELNSQLKAKVAFKLIWKKKSLGQG